MHLVYGLYLCVIILICANILICLNIQSLRHEKVPTNTLPFNIK